MDVHTISDQQRIFDKKPKSSRASTPEARPLSPAERYGSLWNESEKDETKNKDLSKWLVKLQSELGSVHEVKRYLKWVKSEPLKTTGYNLNPSELAIDLAKADWIKGNGSLLHLNSSLSYSITATVGRSQHHDRQDLKRRYKGYEQGLQIHGRPIAYIQADPEEYADKGIAVNSELVLALGYHEHFNGPVKTKLERKSILFAPLGHILTKFASPGQWIYTGLVLIAEIKDNGRAGSLHLIFPRGGHRDVNSKAYNGPAALSDNEWKKLRKFQDDLPFTVAKLEDEFDVLKEDYSLPNQKREITPTAITDLPVEIVETGSIITGEPSPPFALYPDEQSRLPFHMIAS